MIDQDGIRNTVQINRLTRAAKEVRSNFVATPNLRVNADSNSAKEASAEEKRNYYAAEKVVGHEN